LISLIFIISISLLVAVPHWQVSGINNATEQVALENQSRATLAQIFGGVAIAIGLYYTWRRISISDILIIQVQQPNRVFYVACNFL